MSHPVVLYHFIQSCESFLCGVCKLIERHLSDRRQSIEGSLLNPTGWVCQCLRVEDMELARSEKKDGEDRFCANTAQYTAQLRE